jgi:ssDNA-binding Zn-finger/Zn-ribbon topoisomerase 1
LHEAKPVDSMPDVECPDCEVSMDAVEFRMYDAKNPKVTTDADAAGILGSLGVSESRPVETVACPECGLVRFYK